MSSRTITLDERLYTYLIDHSVREHPVLAELREATRTHPHAGMQIAPDQGQLMALLVKLIGARKHDRGRRIHRLQLACGGACAARRRHDPRLRHQRRVHADGAQASGSRPAWRRRSTLVLAPASATLDARIKAGEAGRYDFAFIDADKTGYDGYYERCLTLLRSGGLIAVDNMLWGGAVAQESKDADTKALQAFNDKVHADERVDLAMLPVGDGLTLVRKR